MKAAFALPPLIAGAVICGTLRAQPTLNVPAQFPAIQAAIASATNGATVLVAPGTYVESLNFLGKAITVRAQGPGPTWIVGNSTARAVSFVLNETAASILDGFSIRGGNGAITIQNSSPTIRNCFIVYNVETLTGSGGGIRIGASSGATANPAISNCTIESNWTNGFGGGIGIDVAAGANVQPLILSCRIAGNFANGTGPNGSGGGIGILGPGNAVIEQCSIDYNWADGPSTAGGGIYTTNGANVSVSGTRIWRNRASVNAGAFTTQGNNCVFSNCLIAENAAPFGGVATTAGNLRISNCTIVGNQYWAGPTPTGGIVVNCFPNHTVVIENSILSGNLGYDLYLQPGCGIASIVTISYSNIGVSTLPSGIAPVSGDPLFVDPARSDYHLSVASPCRDAGNPMAAGLPASDIDGTPRVIGAAVDIGCDEYPAAPFAGSNEDLDLLTGIDGGGDPQASVLNPQVGQTLRLRLASVGGTFQGAPPLIVAQAFPSGMPPAPVPGFPALRIDPFSSFLVLYGALSAPPFPSPGLPGEGLTFETLVPPGLLGTVVRLQGFAVTPGAANAVFAATAARDVVMP